MRTIANPGDLAGLLGRLRALRPDSPRRWGTLTPGEMLCHLGDAGEGVLGIRITPGPKPSGVPNRLQKWFALRTPIPWPRGVETRPGVNPRKEGTRPGDFEHDRERVIASLEGLAVAPRERLTPAHFRFGPMTREDWQRWAWRHVHHHLRQFGL